MSTKPAYLQFASTLPQQISRNYYLLLIQVKSIIGISRRALAGKVTIKYDGMHANLAATSNGNRFIFEMCFTSANLKYQMLVEILVNLYFGGYFSFSRGVQFLKGR